MGDNATAALVQGGEIMDAPAPTSIDDELAAIREKASQGRKPKLFELPLYGRKLMVKYRVTDYDEAIEIGDKISEQLRAEQIEDGRLAGLSDMLVKACVGFFVEVDGEVVPLEEAKGLDGGPIRWGDERLWNLLRLAPQEGETLRVRAAIRQILGDDKMLVVEHAEDVARWAERARRSIDEDF
jgi:hypothetical protein